MALDLSSHSKASRALIEDPKERKLWAAILQHCRTPRQKGKHKSTCTSLPWQHKFRPWLLHALLIPFPKRYLDPVLLICKVATQGLRAHSVFVQLGEAGLTSLMSRLLPAPSIFPPLWGVRSNGSYCKLICRPLPFRPGFQGPRGHPCCPWIIALLILSFSHQDELGLPFLNQCLVFSFSLKSSPCLCVSLSWSDR